ncbi:methyltransferase family protein [Streptomyces sp. NPDC019531]|uniref:methyltransferase family protein n=1 Tax=Streptomyces sp. NPDC019531 TaxID=3365062 RepID=UPI0038502360
MLGLLWAFGRFVIEGLGTPAPVAPTEHLVVGGLYRDVAGQGPLLARAALFVYGPGAGLLMWAFARWYEESELARTFGTEYERYRRPVPGWWPRATPRHDG